MAVTKTSDWNPVALQRTRVEGGFWGPRVAANREATLPAVGEFCRTTGRMGAFRHAARPEAYHDTRPPHQFWDSDVAKWVEAMALSLTTDPDPQRRRELDEVVDAIVSAQQPDGYLNTHFTLTGLARRFSNLRDMHELYCAGHLIEAAVAHHQATGSRKLLDAMCRYVDLIDATFGREPGKMKGYPGHEEIELALVRLYQVTGNPRHRELARYFIDERGKQPSYFDQEASRRGDTRPRRPLGYYQAHAPVREQSDAEGHAVRVMYLLAGMADVARVSGDESLLDAARRIWESTTERRMYITGGIGSCHHDEKFTFDFDLPNEEAYAETCAAIGLVMAGSRLLHTDDAGGFDRRYADVMERALYNGVISGVSMDGRRFFYDNYLASKPPYHEFFGRSAPPRRESFSCACCPPNLARLLASLGSYAWSTSADGVAIHLFVQGQAQATIDGRAVTLRTTTDYPWDETVTVTVDVPEPTRFTTAMRLPAWCATPQLTINGIEEAVEPLPGRGYLYLDREWRSGDEIRLTLPMPARRVYAHPSVRHDAGRVAVARGPVVYCLEETDNGPDLNALALPRQAPLIARSDASAPGGATVIEATGERAVSDDWDRRLYRDQPPAVHQSPLRFVPYALWSNREPGEMTVWVRERP